ncbi:MAG: hypothetical protein QNK35_16165, partial [Bacteroides sp.]|nr:hypothetical protein [Bacteroides sp.]
MYKILAGLLLSCTPGLNAQDVVHTQDVQPALDTIVSTTIFLGDTLAVSREAVPDSAFGEFVKPCGALPFAINVAPFSVVLSIDSASWYLELALPMVK